MLPVRALHVSFTFFVIAFNGFRSAALIVLAGRCDLQCWQGFLHVCPPGKSADEHTVARSRQSVADAGGGNPHMGRHATKLARRPRPSIERRGGSWREDDLAKIFKNLALKQALAGLAKPATSLGGLFRETSSREISSPSPPKPAGETSAIFGRFDSPYCSRVQGCISGHLVVLVYMIWSLSTNLTTVLFLSRTISTGTGGCMPAASEMPPKPIVQTTPY